MCNAPKKVGALRVECEEELRAVRDKLAVARERGKVLRYVYTERLERKEALLADALCRVERLERLMERKAVLLRKLLES
jgi:hypothetical protein